MHHVLLLSTVAYHVLFSLGCDLFVLTNVSQFISLNVFFVLSLIFILNLVISYAVFSRFFGLFSNKKWLLLFFNAMICRFFLKRCHGFSMLLLRGVFFLRS